MADGEPGNAYQEIRSLTGDMLDRARHGEWDELIRVETRRQELLDAVIGLRGDETGGEVNAHRPHSPPLGAGLGRTGSWFCSSRIEDSPQLAAGNFNAAPTAELIDGILAGHRELEPLIAERLSELAHAIGTAGVKDRARRAYGFNLEEEDPCDSS